MDLCLPTTLAEFETLLGALREAGVEPLVFGNLDKWQAIHLFGEIQGTNTTREYLDGLIYRRGDADFTDPSIARGRPKVIDWNDAGYFMEGFDGVTADDAQALFITGSAESCSRAAGRPAQCATDWARMRRAFFLMPPRAGSDRPGALRHVGGVGIPYSITTNAADPDVAATFLESLVSEDSFDKVHRRRDSSRSVRSPKT